MPSEDTDMIAYALPIRPPLSVLDIVYYNAEINPSINSKYIICAPDEIYLA